MSLDGVISDPQEWSPPYWDEEHAEYARGLQNVVKYGTGSSRKTLLEQKLVDEYHFWVFPELVGSGERLFDGVRDGLQLVDTTRLASSRAGRSRRRARPPITELRSVEPSQGGAMRIWTFERLGALAGLGFILLSLIGDLSTGNPPGTDDSPAKIVTFFEDHHRGVILSVVLTGLAGPLFLWFLATLALRLRAVGETTWAVAGFGLGLVALAAGVAADTLYGSLARISTTGDGDLTKSVYQLDGFFTAKSFWFAAGAILAFAIAAWRVLPQWYALVSGVAAVICALGGIAVANDGFLAPLNGLTAIAFAALLVWIIASVIMLWRPVQAVRATP